MSYRSVENFKYTQEDRYVEDGIQFYIAHHATSNLPYLLKKVSTNNQSKSKYKSLLNEIGILKMLTNPAIVQCHKMLKTTNNIYLVYDYCDGSPLSDVIKTLSRQAKISIATQITEVLKLMASASIVHCSLKPSFIIVSNDKKIKVMNFIYGVDRSKNKKCIVDFKPVASKYIAPQILKEGVAHQKTDFYSFGVILQQLNIGPEKGNFLQVGNNSAVSQIPQLIEMLISQNPNDRPNIEEVEAMLKGKTTKAARKLSDVIERSSASSLRKTKSISSNEESSNKKILLSPVSAVSDSKGNQKKFVQQVLKRRNLAIFLLEMSKTCLKIEEEQKKLSMFLSYIFMKKSCRIICGLLSFLKGEKGFQKQLQKPILDKAERASFEKKPDFYKIISTIQKEAGNQKRWLQDIYRDISPQYPTKLKQLAPEQQTNDRVLIGYVTEFLAEIIQKGTDQLTGKLAQSLFLMSEVIPHKSYQKMFEQMISEQKVSLDEQYLYIHIRKMQRKQLISQIESRIQAA